MRASVLTIGDELLSGKTINTNVSWISQKLTVAGCSVIRHLTVCDQEQEIKDNSRSRSAKLRIAEKLN